MTHTDGWSWFDAPELSDIDLNDHDVTAVLVCRNAGDWLNATLAGIGQLDRRPDVVLAVDNGSSDDTGQLLADAYEAGLVDRVVQGAANFTFGQAVERALTLVEAPTRWIWLLHDDAVPEHDALTELLNLAARTPRLAMAVPLLIRPTRRGHAARTLEVGATISASGRRVLGLEPDEVAQGQYESASVLGGSTCGMLVRWESLIELGGFDTAIPGYRDGVDLGWRAQLIDQWVLTCPRARIVHRQAGRSEIRRGTLAAQAHRSEASWDKLMGLRLVAAHSRGLFKFTTLAYLTLVSWVTALGYLIGRAPDHARDEMTAWSDFFFHSRRPVARLRRKTARIASGADTRYRVRSLRPTLGTILGEWRQGLIRWFRDQFSSGRDSGMTLDDLLGDEFTRRIGEGRKRVPAGAWFVVVVAGVAAMARNLYASGLVRASELLGPPATLTDAFAQALTAPGIGQPWLLVTAAASALTVHPAWLPVAGLVIAFPFTMLMAVWYLRGRIHHGAIRWLAAAGYACWPILLGGLNAGALWLVAVAVVLPFLAEWVGRLSTGWAGARSLQALAGIALSGIVLVSVQPVLWLPVMVLAVVVSARTSGVAGVVRAVVAVLLPLGFWAQAVPAWLAEPARLLLTPEPLLTPRPTTWMMLFGRPASTPGVPVLWVSLAVFGVAWFAVAIVSVLGGNHRRPVIPGLAAIAVGMWLSVASVPLESGVVHPDARPWLLAGFALMVYAAIAWVDGTLGSLEGRDFGGRQALVGLLTLLLLGAFLLSAVWSVVSGMSRVTRGPETVVPAYLAQNEIDYDAGTLIIDGPADTWNLRYGGQTFTGAGTWRTGAVGVPGSATLEKIVARVLAGRPDDSMAAGLAQYGVSTVVVLNPSQDALTALDTTVGFQRTTTGGAVEIWTVSVNSASPTRRALVGPGGTTTYLAAGDEVPPGTGRTLVLAMPPDPNRHVLVGGVEVAPAPSGDWRSAYTLGTASGTVTLTYSIPREWFAWTQLGVLIVLLVFLLPPLGQENPAPDRGRRGMRPR